MLRKLSMYVILASGTLMLAVPATAAVEEERVCSCMAWWQDGKWHYDAACVEYFETDCSNDQECEARCF